MITNKADQARTPLKGRRRWTIILLVFMLVWLGFIPSVLASTTSIDGSPPEVVIWYFWGEGCRKCSTASNWLDDLSANYPNIVVHKREIWQDLSEQQRYIEMLSALGIDASVVPAIIINERAWLGFNSAYASEIEEEVVLALANDGIVPEGNKRLSSHVIDMGPFGIIYLAQQPLLLATVLIAFVDGFNPCSLWVLSILLAMTLSSTSRVRIIAVGSTFLVITALVYGLFIAGCFSVLAIVSHMRWLQVVVIVLALFFAVINIKDYFFYKKGLSLTIPDRMKQKIYRGSREVRKEQSLPALIAITTVLALGASLVEIPCTAGFPLVWTGMLSSSGVSGWNFILLLMVYLAIYVLIEFAIIVAAIVTLRTTRLQEIHGRTLKLIGGIIMAIVGVGLILNL